MVRQFVMVDLFAGPGGLSEGFWGFRLPSGERPFRTGLSVEKEPSAHATLLFRNFYRQFDGEPPAEYHSFLSGGEEPDWAARWPAEWKAASRETLLHTLKRGQENGDKLLDPLLDDLRARTHGDVILLGGPPCQAYSLVGRARNAGISSYRPEKDERHFLYEEYLRILARLRPAVFVMENVRGFLSSRVGSTRIFERVLEDLDGLARGQDGYCLFAAGSTAEHEGLPGMEPERQPTDFLVRAEEFGIPQMRHRVFIIGVRRDCLAGVGQQLRIRRLPQAHLRHVLDGMPPLRSGLSRGDDPDKWLETVSNALAFLRLANLKGCGLEETRKFARLASETARKIGNMAGLPRRSTERAGVAPDCPPDLAGWILDPKLEGIPNHETRGHMPSDLVRYMFAILHGLATGRSPKAHEFPEELAPDHRNWKTGKFADRFRVQLPDRPSTTITAHISKDGHYFIHPDPLQCRSLTVREAARLQTFPDNYLFRGNRTQQYVQVGNAVPPLLANLLAEAIYELIEGR